MLGKLGTRSTDDTRSTHDKRSTYGPRNTGGKRSARGTCHDKSHTQIRENGTSWPSLWRKARNTGQMEGIWLQTINAPQKLPNKLKHDR